MHCGCHPHRTRVCSASVNVSLPPGLPVISETGRHRSSGYLRDTSGRQRAQLGEASAAPLASTNCVPAGAVVQRKPITGLVRQRDRQRRIAPSMLSLSVKRCAFAQRLPAPMLPVPALVAHCSALAAFGGGDARALPRRRQVDIVFAPARVVAADGIVTGGRTTRTDDNAHAVRHERICLPYPAPVIVVAPPPRRWGRSATRPHHRESELIFVRGQIGGTIETHARHCPHARRSKYSGRRRGEKDRRLELSVEIKDR